MLLRTITEMRQHSKTRSGILTPLQPIMPARGRTEQVRPVPRHSRESIPAALRRNSIGAEAGTGVDRQKVGEFPELCHLGSHRSISAFSLFDQEYDPCFGVLGDLDPVTGFTDQIGNIDHR